jgi:cell wall-associated NlpC family hydrolase
LKEAITQRQFIGASLANVNRRYVLCVLAGVVVSVRAWPARGGETRIGRLIVEARQYPTISQRIDFISAALRGTRYRGYTLIGGPRRPEKFVVRDDGFDCVTFCETVLAAALARDLGEFETSLRQIRYHNGVVQWRERNHYFFEWSRYNVENKVCRAIAMDGAIEIEKTVYWHRALGKRRFSMVVVPRAIFLANKHRLANGDIVGFVTRRPDLDYFHVGFVIFNRHGEMLLRHAAKSRQRVLDERMDRFVALNRVGYVTLLRPQEPVTDAIAVRQGI